LASAEVALQFNQLWMVELTKAKYATLAGARRAKREQFTNYIAWHTTATQDAAAIKEAAAWDGKELRAGVMFGAMSIWGQL
jgi:hypothetical protein